MRSEAWRMIRDYGRIFLLVVLLVGPVVVVLWLRGWR